MTDKYTFDDIKDYTFSENSAMVLSKGRMRAWVKTDKMLQLMNKAYNEGLEEGYQLAIEKCLRG